MRGSREGDVLEYHGVWGRKSAAGGDTGKRMLTFVTIIAWNTKKLLTKQLGTKGSCILDSGVFCCLSHLCYEMSTPSPRDGAL